MGASGMDTMWHCHKWMKKQSDDGDSPHVPTCQRVICHGHKSKVVDYHVSQLVIGDVGIAEGK